MNRRRSSLRHSVARAEVLDALSLAPSTAAELAALSSLHRSMIYRTVGILAQAGKIVEAGTVPARFNKAVKLWRLRPPNP